MAAPNPKEAIDELAIDSKAIGEAAINEAAQRALAEDLGAGDVTTNAVIPAGARARASIVARERCVVAGIPIARRVFELLDPDVTFRPGPADGDRLEWKGGIGLRGEGSRDPERRAGGAQLSPGPLRHRHDHARLHRAGGEFLVRTFSESSLQQRVALQSSTRGRRPRAFAPSSATPSASAAAQCTARVSSTRCSSKRTTSPCRVSRSRPRCGRRARKLAMAWWWVPRLATTRRRARRSRGRQLCPPRQLLAEGAPRGGGPPAGIIGIKPGIEPESHKSGDRGLGGIRIDNVADFAAAGVDRISVGALTHSARAIDLALDVEALDGRRSLERRETQ